MILSAYAKRLAASLKAAGGAALIEFNAGTSYAAGTIGAAVKKLGQDLADMADGFTFTGPVALPGNAAQPLQAVPLQQVQAADAQTLAAAGTAAVQGDQDTLKQVGDVFAANIRLVNDITSGDAVQFDTANKNTGGYWSESTKAVNGPAGRFGIVSTRFEVMNQSGAIKTVAFTLRVGGAVRDKVFLTIASGAVDYVNLIHMGSVGGTISVTCSETMAVNGVYVRGAASGGNATVGQLTLIVFPQGNP